MYVGLKQPRGDGERYMTPARVAAKETSRVRTVDFIDNKQNKRTKTPYVPSLPSSNIM